MGNRVTHRTHARPYVQKNVMTTNADIIRKIRRAEGAVGNIIATGNTKDRLTILVAILTQLECEDNLRRKLSLVEPLVQLCELIKDLLASLDPESGAFRILPPRKGQASIPMFVLGSDVIGTKGEVTFTVVLHTAAAALAAATEIVPDPSLLRTSFPGSIDSISQSAGVPEEPEEEPEAPLDDASVVGPVEPLDEAKYDSIVLQNESSEFIPTHNFVLGAVGLRALRKGHTYIRYAHVPDAVRSIWETLGATPPQVHDLWCHMFTTLWEYWYKFFLVPISQSRTGPDIEDFDAGSVANGVRLKRDFLLRS